MNGLDAYWQLAQQREASPRGIAEIELAVLSNMCLAQRIPDEDSLRQQVAANVLGRNAKASPVK